MRTLGGEQPSSETSGSSSWDPDSLDQLNLTVFPGMTPDQIVECWRKNYHNGYLNAKQFREYWRYRMPALYSPSMNCDCLHITFDEDEVKRTLLDPLELFICGRDPQAVFKELSELDNPPALCGKLFKMGEPTYSCRDCGTDPTCVLCVDCFKKSAHKQHRYKLSMSVGGGYCDCGDPEAWKSEAFCEYHSKGQEAAEGGREKLMARMPADVMGRAKIVLSTVLKYAYQILTSESTMSLPQDLQIHDLEHENTRMTEDDIYCTLLFNDETHTFEQVIDTLKRAIECSQKEAIEYATAIDREGRCIVKCSNFVNCNSVRLVIERQTSRQPANQKPLKVVVMPAFVMAHQIGSMKLLNWLQQLLGCCEAFRILFSDIAMEAPGKEMSVVEGILNFDTQLWKSARTLWHHLFISGPLMDFDNKKRFAKIFTKYYNVMMKDFINDDHDHSYSVSSLSVQLFTVPSISHHLISVDDVLAILLRFFTSECERRRNDEGKLSFERTGNALRRAMYVLFDLKYLLSSKPDSWNEGLRRGFLHGFDLLVNLLGWMQGMDATKRQVGQHMEYEPEWEFAFNLHFKLAPVLSLVVDWCGTDKKVLTKVYRNILKKIGECLEPEMKNRTKLCEVANHSVMCIDYDVSSRPVSIHLPLSRIFAGLNLLLSRFGMDYYGFENVSSKPDPVQIIEPVLRTQVMVAQVQAGMWRRNGYSLINQIYFYKNVKCRTEMFDRDITLLQVGASLIEPNEFLIHLLNKFDLVDWAQKNYEKKTPTTPNRVEDEDAIRQTTVLVEEFLNLIIQIVGERHVPGIGEVTKENQTAKEIIHQLCIEPMPHSALNKALPEDTSHETHIESVIDKIARFKKPGQGGYKGVYELKEEFFENFDVFFYHYTREEMSKAEEAQIKRRKAAGLEVCCPPPKLPAFTPAFRQISNILQSDVMLHIFQTIFERTADLWSKTISETQFHMALHLIGYALHEEVSFLAGENPIGYHFTDRAYKYQILMLMEKLKGNARIDAHKVLLDWTILKYKEVLASKGVGGAVTPLAEKMAVDSDEAKAEEEEKKRKAKIAAARKAAIMAQMAAAQKTFIMEHKEEFDTASGMKSGFGSMESMMDVVEESAPVAFGPCQTGQIDRDKKLVCILCQEDQPVDDSGRGFVYGAFVQRSTVMCQNTSRLPGVMDAMPKLLEDSPYCSDPEVMVSAFVSSCGHSMHGSCWQTYVDGLIARERRRPRPRPSSSYDVEKAEFLCPLCQCLSNAVIPVLPPLTASSGRRQPSSEPSQLSFQEWLQAVDIVTQSLVWQEPEKPKHEDDVIDIRRFDPDVICRFEKALVMVGRADVLPDVEPQSASKVSIDRGVSDMIQLFFQSILTVGFDETINNAHPRLAAAICQAASYTFLSTQNYQLSEGKGLFGLSSRQLDTLSSLARCLSYLPHLFGGMESQDKTLENIFYGALDTLMQHEKSRTPPMDKVDPFSVLITLLVGSSTVTRSGRVGQRIFSVMDLYFVKVAFALQIVQSLLVLQLPTAEESMDEDELEALSAGEAVLVELYQKARGQPCTCPARRLIQEVEACCKTFLRCVALFGQFFSEVAVPTEMKEPGGDSIQSLLRFIGLESVEEVVQEDWFVSYFERCLRKRPVRECSLRHPLRGRSLIELPSDYSELINEVAQFTCPNSEGDESRTPTRCLLCGVMLCSQSYCCQMELDGTLVGACTHHAHFCGAGVGIFLRVRECKILLLAGQSKGCYMPPPYLDKYGETDQGMKRGDPLHLCEANYRKWQQLWLSHSVQEHISHAMETSQSLLQTDWHHV